MTAFRSSGDQSKTDFPEWQTCRRLAFSHNQEAVQHCHCLILAQPGQCFPGQHIGSYADVLIHPWRSSAVGFVFTLPENCPIAPGHSRTEWKRCIPGQSFSGSPSVTPGEIRCGFGYASDVHPQAQEFLGLLHKKAGRFDRLHETEREGFEPSIELPLYSISSAAPSTTRPPLHGQAGQMSM